MPRDTSSRRRAPSGLPYAVTLPTALGALRIPAHAGLNFGAGSFAIGWWVNMRNSVDTAAVFQLGSVLAASGFRFYRINQLFYLVTAAGTLFNTSFFSPAVGNMSRVWVVFDASDLKVRLYRNGALVYTSSALAAWNYASGLLGYLGVGELGCTPMTFADPTIVKGSAPTLADIQADYYDNVQMPSTVLRYKLNEGSGTAPADSIGGVVATLTGAGVNAPTWTRFESARVTSSARDTSTARTATP